MCSYSHVWCSVQSSQGSVAACVLSGLLNTRKNLVFDRIVHVKHTKPVHHSSVEPELCSVWIVSRSEKIQFGSAIRCLHNM